MDLLINALEEESPFLHRGGPLSEVFALLPLLLLQCRLSPAGSHGRLTSSRRDARSRNCVPLALTPIPKLWRRLLSSLFGIQSPVRPAASYPFRILLHITSPRSAGPWVEGAKAAELTRPILLPQLHLMRPRSCVALAPPRGADHGRPRAAALLGTAATNCLLVRYKRL
jgi:hypothetical protein